MYSFYHKYNRHILRSFARSLRSLHSINICNKQISKFVSDVFMKNIKNDFRGNSLKKLTKKTTIEEKIQYTRLLLVKMKMLSSSDHLTLL